MTVPGMERPATAPRLHCLVVVTHTKSHGTVSGNDPARSVKTRARITGLEVDNGSRDGEAGNRAQVALLGGGHPYKVARDRVRERSGQVGEDQGQVAFVLEI